MKPHGEAVIEHSAEHDPDKSSYSIVQLADTSSITAHFLDKSGDAYIDVISRRFSSIDLAREIVVRFFRPRCIRVTYLTRQA